MNRRSLLLSSLSLLPFNTLSKKKKKKKTITIKNKAGDAWKQPIIEALGYINPQLKKTRYRLTTRKANITIFLADPAEMLNPGAWAEAPLNGNYIRISTDATPNPGLICHEITHLRGHDHSEDWVNLRPCPFKKIA